MGTKKPTQAGTYPFGMLTISLYPSPAFSVKIIVFLFTAFVIDNVPHRGGAQVKTLSHRGYGQLHLKSCRHHLSDLLAYFIVPAGSIHTPIPLSI
jgi:hypothetical protein